MKTWQKVILGLAGALGIVGVIKLVTSKPAKQPAPPEPRMGNLYGVVRDDSGPVIGASVIISERAVAFQTDADGYYQITNIPVGNYGLTVEKTGYHPFWAEVTVKEGNNELNIKLAKEITPPPNMLAFYLNSNAIYWSLGAFDINTKESIGSSEGMTTLGTPQTLPFITDFLLYWTEQYAGLNAATFGPYLVHVTAPGDYVIDKFKMTLNGVPLKLIQPRPCQFVGTVRNAEGSPKFTIELTLNAISPDDTENFYHYQIGIPFTIRAYDQPPIGMPYGNADIIVWKVPDGTLITGAIDYTEDYGLCIVAAKAATDYNPAAYQFSGTLTKSNQWSETGTAFAYITYKINELNAKSFAWAFIWKSLMGYQNEILQASGAGPGQGTYKNFMTYPQTQQLQLWVNPDPNAEWRDYQSYQNAQIRQFYGWILIAYV